METSALCFPKRIPQDAIGQAARICTSLFRRPPAADQQQQNHCAPGRSGDLKRAIAEALKQLRLHGLDELLRVVPLRTFSFAGCRLEAMGQPLGFTVDHVNSRLAHPILAAYLGDELTKRRSYLEPFTRCTRGTIPSSFGTSEEQDQRHDLHESKFRRRSTANLHLQVPNPGKYFCKRLPFNELSTQDVSSQSLKAAYLERKHSRHVRGV